MGKYKLPEMMSRSMDLGGAQGIAERLMGPTSSMDEVLNSFPGSQAGKSGKVKSEEKEAREAMGISKSVQPVTAVAMLGALVREARKDMGLNQQQFADLSGVGRRFISELESGKSTLEVDKVLQVCVAAGIDITAMRRDA